MPALKELSAIVLCTGRGTRARSFEAGLSSVVRNLEATGAFREILSGMHSSIRVGLLALEPGWDGVLVALVDQPHLTSEDYLWVADIFRSSGPECSLVRPIFHGIAGNPTVIGRAHLEEVLAEPDSDSCRGGEYLFKRHPASVVEIEMPSESCLMHFDGAKKEARSLSRPGP